MAAMPLDGVRILDFTWVVAGPVATRILGDHGAQVVKVERKNPPPMGNRKLGLQCDLHRSKLSVALNMQHPRGVELARRLAAMSDIVMDNFSARVMRTWGMDYESLNAVKPDIICISMSGLGHTGPRSSYVSYGPTLQALTGYTQLMAEPDGTPAGYGYSYADMCGGYTGALAALVALWHRRRTGRGQFVDLSQFEAVASVIGPALLDISVNGRTQSAPGYNSQEGPAAPHGVYKCRALDGDDDRWVAISVAHGPRMAPIRRRDRFSGVGERSEVPHALSADAKQRRARRQRLAMDRGAQRRRRDGDTAARGHRSGRRRERRRSVRARSSTERARLLARGLDAKRVRRLTSRESRSSFPAAREKLAGSRPKSARISTTCSASARLCGQIAAGPRHELVASRDARRLASP